MVAAPDPVRAVVADVTQLLVEAGVPSPRFDAEELVALALGVPRSRLVAARDVPSTAMAQITRLAAERAARVPLQHLVGRAPFRRLDLLVGPGVFVPRPETELLVDECLRLLAGSHEPLVVDPCTGSGAVALAVAQEFPGQARVWAVEADPAAFRWLQRNAAARAAAGDRPVTCVLAPAATALPAMSGTAAVVVANPPYVPAGDRAAVDPEVAEHDPPAAVWGGADGLDVIREVAAAAARLTAPGGGLVVEHSDRQGEAVPALLDATGEWSDVRDHADLTGRPRYTTARRRP